MILKGNRRGGAMQMAMHLLNIEDNEHITIHELRGFVSENLAGAFSEAYGISRGTRCKKFLYSLSLSPPQQEKVSVDAFEKAIDEIEQRFGFENQPRVIVFHEKEGRRHAHCVWSRIDAQRMKAIDVSHDKLKLRDMSRELYLKHGWKMPRGLMNSEECDPLNFTMAEFQQASRTKQGPRAIKQTFQDCWAISDSCAAFASALEERGYYLTKGDRRGHVALDWRGEVYAVSRWVGIRTKEVKAKLGDSDDMPSLENTKKRMSERFTERLKQYTEEEITRHHQTSLSFNKKRKAMVSVHQQAREQLEQSHVKRWRKETRGRISRLPTGLKALWFRVTGKYRKIKKQSELETASSKHRDQSEMQSLINQQLRVRRRLQHELRQLRHHHTVTIKRLNREVSTYLKLSSSEQRSALSKSPTPGVTRKRRQSRPFG